MNQPLRVVFMGTPTLARVILARLASQAGTPWQVVGVVAQPDKPSGRNLLVQPPPVKEEALARGLPVLQPEKARDPAFIEAFMNAIHQESIRRQGSVWNTTTEAGGEERSGTQG